MNAQDILQDYVLKALVQMKKPEGGDYWMLVVDSLDEAVLTDVKDNSILDIVVEMAESDKFPPWLKLLVTSRPQANVTDKLNHADKIDLEAVLKEDKEKNLEDIRAYVKERMTFEVCPPQKYRMQTALDIVSLEEWADVDVLKGYVEAVVEKSDGMFLYAVYIFDDIEKKKLSLGQSIEEFKGHLPKGLSGFYEKRFNDMGFGKKGSERDWYLKEVVPVIEVIVAAREPPSLNVLLEATGREEQELLDVIDEISTFLKIEKQEGDEERYTFMHQSFTDWIVNR
jgi:hypothetical protein